MKKTLLSKQVFYKNAFEIMPPKQANMIREEFVMTTRKNTHCYPNTA